MELGNFGGAGANSFASANSSASVFATCVAYYNLSTTVWNQIGNQDLIWIDSSHYLHGSLIEQVNTLQVHYEMALIDASVTSGLKQSFKFILPEF